MLGEGGRAILTSFYPCDAMGFTLNFAKVGGAGAAARFAPSSPVHVSLGLQINMYPVGLRSRSRSRPESW